jgi:apolipoprotein N-acyltransferase
MDHFGVRRLDAALDRAGTTHPLTVNAKSFIKAHLLRALAALGSGLLVWSAFPPVGGAEAAWVGLVPLILLAEFSSPRESFRWGFLSGLVFWLLTLSWLLRLGVTGTPWPVAALGWIGLSAYCALYWGGFAAGVSDWLRRPFGRAGALVALPALWVGLEYVRSTFGTGFPWNGLGISQYRNVAVIQWAEWGGVYAVSAMLVLMNAALALTALRMIDRYRGRRGRRWHPELMIGLTVCALVWMHGVRSARRWTAADDGTVPVRIAAIQPNVPQLKKWPEQFEEEILERLSERTGMAVPSRPDLVVWPETALPGAFPSDPVLHGWTVENAPKEAPILFGAMEVDRVGGGEPPDDDARLYNSAFLLAPGGRVEGVYRKCHLVPFGEYLPFERRVPFLKRFAPLGFSCTPGEGMTVFEMPAAGHPFSALICFEDAFAYLAREAVDGGARFLVNLTNDAWFDGSAASVQHMSHAVFRCVENRVPMARCANTGVTCFIDRVGRLDDTTRGMLDSGETHLAQYRVGSVRVNADGPPTVYRRYGDWVFGIPCAVAAGAWLIALRVRFGRKAGG